MMGPREAHAALDRLVAQGRSNPDDAARVVALLDLCALHAQVTEDKRMARAVRRGLLLALAHTPPPRVWEPPLQPLLSEWLAEADLLGLPWRDAEEVLAAAHTLTGLLPPPWLRRMVDDALRGFVRAGNSRAVCHLVQRGAAFLPPDALPAPHATRLVRHYTLFLLHLVVFVLLLPLLLVRAEGGQHAGPAIPPVGGGVGIAPPSEPPYLYLEGLYDVMMTPLGPMERQGGPQTQEGRTVVWLAATTKVSLVVTTARLIREVRWLRRGEGRIALLARAWPPS